jgi:hypothetical protein
MLTFIFLRNMVPKWRGRHCALLLFAGKITLETYVDTLVIQHAPCTMHSTYTMHHTPYTIHQETYGCSTILILYHTHTLLILILYSYATHTHTLLILDSYSTHTLPCSILLYATHTLHSTLLILYTLLHTHILLYSLLFRYLMQHTPSTIHHPLTAYTIHSLCIHHPPSTHSTYNKHSLCIRRYLMQHHILLTLSYSTLLSTLQVLDAAPHPPHQERQGHPDSDCRLPAVQPTAGGWHLHLLRCESVPNNAQHARY